MWAGAGETGGATHAVTGGVLVALYQSIEGVGGGCV